MEGGNPNGKSEDGRRRWKMEGGNPNRVRRRKTEVGGWKVEGGNPNGKSEDGRRKMEGGEWNEKNPELMFKSSWISW